eukprot:TRINITY_DN82302_c0_g1_i1.p1 TRINITY_DN82302_c0_g1~~TRINITY_DN82302_c0_g1_i1.p1  ORF type:complete len:260 (-),score=45.82 TRINITY_DN82302_c0_g1_i1:37-738(-)
MNTICSKALRFAGLALAAATSPEILQGDDECAGAEHCSLTALQVQALRSEAEVHEHDDYYPHHHHHTHGHGGWTWGGDKLWGWGSQAGHGVESIDDSNVLFYNKGMKKALSHCGGPGCSLIMNPPGHRSKEVPHIHSVPLNSSYGQHLHEKVEKLTCGDIGGWHKGHLPCHGKAAFFSGFSEIFENAMTSGSIASASVIVWPYSCGGSGTIIEIAYRCSIEHQIRGDFNPHHR